MTWRLSNTKYAGIKALNLIFRQVPRLQGQGHLQVCLLWQNLLPPNPNLILASAVAFFDSNKWNKFERGDRQELEYDKN
jgi:hypothetical protein